MSSYCIDYVWIEGPADAVDAVRHLATADYLLADPPVVVLVDDSRSGSISGYCRLRYRYLTRYGPAEAPLARLSAHPGVLRVTLVYVDEMCRFQGYAEFLGGFRVGGAHDLIADQRGELPDRYPFAAQLKAEWAKRLADVAASPAVAGSTVAGRARRADSPAAVEGQPVPDRALVYEATETLYLVHLTIFDRAYTLDSIVAGLASGHLWLENATAGDATVRATDPNDPDGRVIAAGLVQRDFEDVRTRNYRAEDLATFGELEKEAGGQQQGPEGPPVS